MAPRKNTAGAAGAGNEAKSSGAPSAGSDAAVASTWETAGSAVSTPGDAGQSPGTNTPESEGKTVGAGDAAGPATGEIFNPRDEVLRITRLNQIASLAEQVRYDNHARIVALFSSSQFPEESPPSAIRVTCSVEGFRRAGVRHVAGAVNYPIDHFTADQLEQLLGDPTFTVELI